MNGCGFQGEYWSIMANAEKYDVPTDSFTVYFQALEDYLTPCWPI